MNANKTNNMPYLISNLKDFKICFWILTLIL
jgi:hypothetical protein